MDDFVTRQDIVKILEEVKDPEIPVLSIVELGVVREVEVDEGEVRVVITPTYSGCPALKMMEQGVISALREKGIDKVSVSTVLAPPWTTDWIGPEAREKLRKYGIAPPVPGRPDDPPKCPFCDSEETELRSEFGSTACKALHFCNACCQPFERFKTL